MPEKVPVPPPVPEPRRRETASGPAENPVEPARAWSLATKIGGATFGTIIAPILVALVLKLIDTGSNPQPPAEPNRTESKATDTSSVSTPALPADSSPSASTSPNPSANSTATKSGSTNPATAKTSAESLVASAQA